MFFIIGGIQPRTIILDKQARSCPSCGRLRLYLKRRDQYLSLFFIPLFPVKRGTPFLLCDGCNAAFDEHFTVFTGIKKQCDRCGRPVERDFSYCPFCGKEL